MIYEMRTYTLRAGTVPEFEKRFAVAIPHREKYSPLAAFWHTEIGPLNQVIHVWPYDDLGARDRIRAEAMKDPNWPPKTSELMVVQESKILTPAPFSPPLEPRNDGPIYEIRAYDVQPGMMPKMVEAFAAALPNRIRHSPLVGAFSTEFGALNQWVHIWAYRSLDERMRLRAEAMKDPTWPPKASEIEWRMASKIVLPAAFSKMR
jgi:hypothetical protein